MLLASKISRVLITLSLILVIFPISSVVCRFFFQATFVAFIFLSTHSYFFSFCRFDYRYMNHLVLHGKAGELGLRRRSDRWGTLEYGLIKAPVLVPKVIPTINLMPPAVIISSPSHYVSIKITHNNSLLKQTWWSYALKSVGLSKKCVKRVLLQPR